MIDREEADFYRRAMEFLKKERIPFLVGGAYAHQHYTGIERHTKDLDLFIRPEHLTPALNLLTKAGYRTEVTAAHWLGKAFHQTHFIDFITGFSNGIDRIDDSWFARAEYGQAFEVDVQFVPPEEMIWMKAFVQTRERYDAADVVHLLRACYAQLDWTLLVDRFQTHWRLLLNHLILFGFVYPGERNRIPASLMEDLMRRLSAELSMQGADRLCQGTLLSQTDFLPDVTLWNYRDARPLLSLWQTQNKKMQPAET